MKTLRNSRLSYRILSFSLLFSVLACASHKTSRTQNANVDGFNPPDQYAQNLKTREQRDQDQKDQRMMATARKRLGPQLPSAQADAPVQALPQRSGRLELKPTKSLDASAKIYAKMPERQLFAEILDRYEAHDLWGFQFRARVFLGKFTNSDHRDEVMFMQGLMELGERNYGVALLQFNRILRDHPNGRKAPAALFAKGVTFKRMNLDREAKQALAKVIDLYPGSPEATRAKAEAKLIR